MSFRLQISSFRFCLTLLSVLLTFNLFATKMLSVEAFEKEFTIQIILEDTFQSTYENLAFKKQKDEHVLNNYINNILKPELRKYPDSYFEKIGLKKIVLCKNLMIAGQKRAAAPDPYVNTLFLSVEKLYEKEYLIHVLHHELHHITEYELWEDMFFDWRKWNRKNTRKFIYGAGGSSAYELENSTVNWGEINNPKTGFLNLYSTLGPEEDRCEIVALIMTERERNLLKSFIPKDKTLKRKVNLTLRTLRKISKGRLKFWKEKLEI